MKKLTSQGIMESPSLPGLVAVAKLDAPRTLLKSPCCWRNVLQEKDSGMRNGGIENDADSFLAVNFLRVTAPLSVCTIDASNEQLGQRSYVIAAENPVLFFAVFFFPFCFLPFFSPGIAF